MLATDPLYLHPDDYLARDGIAHNIANGRYTLQLHPCSVDILPATRSQPFQKSMRLSYTLYEDKW
jgi:hypothetical protein